MLSELLCFMPWPSRIMNIPLMQLVEFRKKNSEQNLNRIFLQFLSTNMIALFIIGVLWYGVDNIPVDRFPSLWWEDGHSVITP